MTNEQHQAFAQYLSAIAGRWAEEKQYEDWTEYHRAITARLAAIAPTATLETTSRRPVSAIYRSNGVLFQAKVMRRQVKVYQITK